MSPRPRGRPRSRAADRAILDATIALLREEGYPRLTIEKVAARAGVGRPTLYRRWPSKTPLVMAAVAAAFERTTPIPPDTGDVYIDLALLLQDTARVLADTPVGDIMRTLLSAASHHPELREAVRTLQHQRRHAFITVLERGVARGVLPSDLATELIVDLLLSPMYVRAFMGGDTFPAAAAHALVHAVLPAPRVPA